MTRLAGTIQVKGLGRLDILVLVRENPVSLSNRRGVASRAATPGVIGAAMLGGKEVNATGPLSSTTLDQPGLVGWGLSPLLWIPGTNPNPSLGISIGVVPDGVTRVKWTFTGAYFGILHPHPVTVYARVENNVAVAAVPRTDGPLADAAWYSASGHLIASGSGGSASRQLLQRFHAVNGTRNVPVAPLLRSHYSLFSAVAPDDLAHDPQFVTAAAASGGGKLNYWQTRYISSVTGLDGRGLWITPGRDGFCITDPKASVCGTLRPQDALAIIGVGTGSASEQTLSGLVPDGNRNVMLVLQSGARVTVPVVDHNVFEATVHGRIVAIINRDVGGRITQYRFAG